MSKKFYFNPEGKNLEVFLGSLEAKVMDLVWEYGPLSTKKVQFLLQSKELAYNTIATVLGRLVQKKLLQRKKDGSYFIYSPLTTKKEYLKTKVNTVKQCLKQFK